MEHKLIDDNKNWFTQSKMHCDDWLWATKNMQNSNQSWVDGSHDFIIIYSKLHRERESKKTSVAHCLFEILCRFFFRVHKSSSKALLMRFIYISTKWHRGASGKYKHKIETIPFVQLVTSRVAINSLKIWRWVFLLFLIVDKRIKALNFWNCSHSFSLTAYKIHRSWLEKTTRPCGINTQHNPSVCALNGLSRHYTWNVTMKNWLRSLPSFIHVARLVAFRNVSRIVALFKNSCSCRRRVKVSKLQTVLPIALQWKTH